jgi:opacity protein-like surface antigen
MLLPKNGLVVLAGKFPRVIALTALIVVGGYGSAQTTKESPNYGKANAFGVFAAYSNDSSHMLLGTTDNRKLLSLGVSYSRRLVQNNVVIWRYDAEVLPVALESDPIETLTYNYTFTEPNAPLPATETFTVTPGGPCRASSGSGSISGFYTYTYTGTCGRRWTIGEAVSPVGLRWNFRPRQAMQPFVDGHGGYMYSTRPIPVMEAGSFNFTFDIGAGVEFYRTRSQSMRAEYRFHHISNDDTAQVNPGIDSGLLQLTYSWSR